MRDLNTDSIFIYWIYFLSLIVLFILILESFGLITNLFISDISRISSLILFIFFTFIFRGGYLLFHLRDAIYSIDQHYETSYSNIFINIYQDYIQNIQSKTNINVKSLNEEFKIKSYSYVDNGFFVADLLMKLGIVGTVIGFIIMLNSVASIDEIDLSKMNNLILNMSLGMQVALYTTLTGLLGSLLLSIQYNFIEQKINLFISKILNINYEKE